MIVRVWAGEIGGVTLKIRHISANFKLAIFFWGKEKAS